ncbi:MAG: DUF1501 domain-containing protein [Sulfuricellaceae bacterium]|nr:DUF1501 domain-containing protein [Sulfuricellaceae bacterium]
MNRRDFMKTLGLLPLVGSPIQSWGATNKPYQNLLILIELKGGNDGLNTVIPFADPLYAQLRPRLSIPREQIIQLDERTGLHPALQALLPLWKDRQLALVQGVGYPKPNLSHFRSIEIWDTASNSEDYLDQGWLARLFAQTPAPASFAAEGVMIANSEAGPLGGGKARTISLASPEQFLRQSRLAKTQAEPSRNPAMDHILTLESNIRAAANGLSSKHAFQTVFPNHAFGKAVHSAVQVAASAGSNPGGIAVIKLSHGSFDTHTNQLNMQNRLLGELAEGIFALKSALLELGKWDSTLIMSYAEFGRRPAENGSGGTDHGTANVHFVTGGKIHGGLYGKAPDLARLEGGNLIHGVDFRSLYATVIQKHWGLEANGVLGARYPVLDFV